MPKLCETLYKAGGARNPNVNLKKFNNYKTAFENFKIRQPNILGNKVSEKNIRLNEGACREELLLMMACWKRHGFQENVCVEEYKTFNKCNAAFRAKLAEKQKFVETNELGIKSESGDMNPQQANKLLRMFPQPPHQLNLTHTHGHKLRKPLTFSGKSDNDTQHAMPKPLFTTMQKSNRK